MKLCALSAVLTVAVCCSLSAHADTFGSGANTFDIEFVPIGNPDNPDDTTGNPNPAGKVEYGYRIAKYKISRGMITKANAGGGLGITMHSMVFVTGGPRDDMPATGVTWFESATFVNWLNTSQGYTPAYKFNDGAFELWQSGDAGYNPSNPFRNSQAFYFLPSADEWYKAAYYDSVAGVYYDYPTGSDTPPVAVGNGTAVGTAVYGQLSSQGPANTMLSGGLSPYGTMGQGGNAFEWEETTFDLKNDSSSSDRGVRGGGWWVLRSSSFSSSIRVRGASPSIETEGVGFRVASVIPEPTSLILALLPLVALATHRWRSR